MSTGKTLSAHPPSILPPMPLGITEASHVGSFIDGLGFRVRPKEKSYWVNGPHPIHGIPLWLASRTWGIIKSHGGGQASMVCLRAEKL